MVGRPRNGVQNGCHVVPILVPSTVAKIDRTVAAMRNAPQNISYNELRSVCVHFFGEPRQSGTSHAVFKTPWPGDPRVNIQKAKDGKAKSYQVRQVLKAIDKVQEERK